MLKKIEKNWAFVAIAMISIFLGILAMLTSLKLRQERPVAPNAPESKPKALEGNPVASCQLTFSLTLVPSPSPSPTPIGGTPICGSTCTVANQGTVCPTGMTCYVQSGQSTGLCRNPQCQTRPDCTCPPAQCGSSCNNDSQCPSSMTCYVAPGFTAGLCRNSACKTDADCVCTASPQPSASPTPTPSTTPKVPKTGGTWPTIFLTVGGVALLIIGLGFTL